MEIIIRLTNEDENAPEEWLAYVLSPFYDVCAAAPTIPETFALLAEYIEAATERDEDERLFHGSMLLLKWEIEKLRSFLSQHDEAQNVIERLDALKKYSQEEEEHADQG